MRVAILENLKWCDDMNMGTESEISGGNVMTWKCKSCFGVL